MSNILEPRNIEITEAQIEEIAERAAKKVLDMVYKEVGKSVLKKLTWLAGVVTFSLMVYLIGKGSFNP